MKKLFIALSLLYGFSVTQLSAVGNSYEIHHNLLEKRKIDVCFSNLLSWQDFHFHSDKSVNTQYKVSLNPDFFKKLSKNQNEEVSQIGDSENNILNLHSFFEYFLQYFVNSIFSNSFFVQALSGENDNTNFVHQSFYLRNLIGDLVGSQHAVQFDVHSNVCPQTLLAVTRQEALQAFYKFANENLMCAISFLRKDFNNYMGQTNWEEMYQEALNLLNDNNVDLSSELDDEDVVRLLIMIGALKEDC